MQLDPVTMFNNWIAQTSIWQDWGKPTVFSAMRGANLQEIRRIAINRDLSILGIPGPDENTAIVLDMDPVASVDLAARLAVEGYQPVPLFNAVPAPERMILGNRGKAAVDLNPVAQRLAAYADDLSELSLPDDAPPAFMLADDRSGRQREPLPGEFDNRWIVFPQDLPSGRLLVERGITQAVVIQSHAQEPARDLVHVLYGWQAAGLSIQLLNYGRHDQPRPIQLARPRGFGSWWRRTLVLLGLRRNAAGGFGAVVPEPSQSGGYS